MRNAVDEKEKMEARVRKDIALFEENFSKIEQVRDPEDAKTIELARAYCEDAKFYLEKGDLFTAFGCINYAHGLLDAVRMRKEFAGENRREQRSNEKLKG
ncbi:MAG: DUF357 domain-containing protein [Candidatus Methanospirare jalkutatii]|nr:DUF357 domain-containing protein [Candidatus Methanospirare jalkutatii]